MKGIEAARKNDGFQELPGVGRAAVQYTAIKGTNLVNVLLVDDDTKCAVIASGTNDLDWTSIGRDVLAALKPELVPPPYRAQ
jgi:hypothetical protein